MISESEAKADRLRRRLEFPEPGRLRRILAQGERLNAELRAELDDPEDEGTLLFPTGPKEVA